MNEAQITAFADSAEQMAAAASDVIRIAAEQPFNVEYKGDGSPVTDVDKAAEDCVRAIIAERYPDHGILGEERTAVAPDAEFCWIIDPIDGTLPFLAGHPVFGTLIGLMQGDTTLVGIIEMPITRERWVGRHGLPTLRNGVPVRTRACADLSQALMSTSNPDYFAAEELPALDRMRAATRLCAYGGSCMSYAQIATGRIDLGMDGDDFSIHDYLPLVPVIKGAGGMVTDWQGNHLGRQSSGAFFAVGDARLHTQALRVLAG